MQKILLTGGSGFLASHILDTLVARKYHATFTVRREEQGHQIISGYPQAEHLDFAVVKDITDEVALTAVFEQHGPFDSVIHTASPFVMAFEDPIRDVLDPAVKGTTTILKVIQKSAPSVKRVVLTSSFAAIVDPQAQIKTYDDKSWNPITWDEAASNNRLTYAGSKALAERAAWSFIEEQKPKFDLVVINPPLVFGPVKNHPSGSDKTNTSNQRILDAALSKFASGNLPPTGVFLWVDVRDAALLHVRACEEPSASGQRLFVTTGHFSNKTLIDTIRETRPDLTNKLPVNAKDDMPTDVYGYDNSKATALLGTGYHSFAACIKDTLDSMV